MRLGMYYVQVQQCCACQKNINFRQDNLDVMRINYITSDQSMYDWCPFCYHKVTGEITDMEDYVRGWWLFFFKSKLGNKVKKSLKQNNGSYVIQKFIKKGERIEGFEMVEKTIIKFWREFILNDS